MQCVVSGGANELSFSVQCVVPGGADYQTKPDIVLSVTQNKTGCLCGAADAAAVWLMQFSLGFKRALWLRNFQKKKGGGHEIGPGGLCGAGTAKLSAPRRGLGPQVI